MYVHTWPPPSGNRTVSVKMTSNPLIGFDPAIFNVLGVQETTSTSNCKTKYAYTLSKENFEKWRWIPSSTTHVQIDLWLLHKSDSLSCTFQTHILKQWKINSTSLRKLSRWQAKRPSKLPIIQCFFSVLQNNVLIEWGRFLLFRAVATSAVIQLGPTLFT